MLFIHYYILYYMYLCNIESYCRTTGQCVEECIYLCICLVSVVPATRMESTMTDYCELSAQQQLIITALAILLRISTSNKCYNCVTFPALCDTLIKSQNHF